MPAARPRVRSWLRMHSDCVELAAKHGITAIIQPGGSIRDEDSIKACDEAGIAMVFTGTRHFKH